MLCFDAALLAFFIVRESWGFITTQMQAVASSLRLTKRSYPRLIARAAAAFQAIVGRRRKSAYVAAIISCFLLCFPRPLSAQPNASGISLSVKDPQGLAILNARTTQKLEAPIAGS